MARYKAIVRNINNEYSIIDINNIKINGQEYQSGKEFINLINTTTTLISGNNYLENYNDFINTMTIGNEVVIYGNNKNYNLDLIEINNPEALFQDKINLDKNPINITNYNAYYTALKWNNNWITNLENIENINKILFNKDSLSYYVSYNNRVNTIEIKIENYDDNNIAYQIYYENYINGIISINPVF